MKIWTRLHKKKKAIKMNVKVTSAKTEKKVMTPMLMNRHKNAPANPLIRTRNCEKSLCLFTVRKEK